MSVLFENLGWKILSVIVAFVLWFIVMNSNSVEISKEVSLHLELPPGLALTNEVPDTVVFRLSGSKFFLRSILNSIETIKIDLTDAKAGPTYYHIMRDSLRLPIGVKVLSVSPATISPVLEAIRTRTVPVSIQTRNAVPKGFKLIKLQAIPKEVRLKGPKSKIEKISVIRTSPIDLSEVPADLRWQFPLEIGMPGVIFDEEQQPIVQVEFEPLGSNFRIAGVPVQVETKHKFKLNVDKVALYVRCSPKIIRTLTPDRIVAKIHIQESKPGEYIKSIDVSLPKGVSLVRTVPERIRIFLED